MDGQGPIYPGARYRSRWEASRPGHLVADKTILVIIKPGHASIPFRERFFLCQDICSMEEWVQKIRDSGHKMHVWWGYRSLGCLVPNKIPC